MMVRRGIKGNQGKNVARKDGEVIDRGKFLMW